MGNLADDTAVVGGDGQYTAALNGDWAIWGPNGGYLAAVAVRAAGAHTSVADARPVSLVCHFLGVASFDVVDLSVVTLRASRRAESVRVSMSQGGEPVLEALVWTAAAGLDGLVHDAAPAPAVPGWSSLVSADERRAAAEGPSYPFWRNLEERPTEWLEDWDNRAAGEPVLTQWLRFRPQAVFDDPFVDAGRLTVAVDTFQWPSATRGHAGAGFAHIAPSLDLACRFHRSASDSEWLLMQARSPVAEDGLVAGTAWVWDEAGRLVASGGQQMLCRPAPPRP